MVTSTQLTADDMWGISQALHAYAGGIDTKDYDLFRTAFTENATASYGEPMPLFDGLDRMTAFMEVLHRDLDYSLHRVTNLYVIEAGDGRARTRSYVTATLVDSDHPDGSTLEVSGTYLHDLRREPAGWRIAHKQFDLLASSGNLSVLAFEKAAAALA